MSEPRVHSKHCPVCGIMKARVELNFCGPNSSGEVEMAKNLAGPIKELDPRSENLAGAITEVINLLKRRANVAFISNPAADPSQHRPENRTSDVLKCLAQVCDGAHTLLAGEVAYYLNRAGKMINHIAMKGTGPSAVRDFNFLQWALIELGLFKMALALAGTGGVVKELASLAPVATAAVMPAKTLTATKVPNRTTRSRAAATMATT